MMVFVMMGDGGFAITEDFRRFYGLTERAEFADVRIQAFANSVEAYCRICHDYVERNVEKWKRYPSLPRLDDLLKYGGVYINPEFSTPIQVVEFKRYFGAVSESAFVVVESFEALAQFIEAYVQAYLIVWEGHNPQRLYQETSKKYVVQRMAMSAYVSSPLMIPQESVLNSVVLDYALQKENGVQTFRQLIEPRL